jgi:hypothetical protein
VIPDLVNIGGPWKVLPPGVHEASLKEIELGYATNDHRRMLFDGFKAGFENLMAAGCKNIFLDGGYVGENPKPKDYDVCWDHKGVDSALIDPVLLDYSDKRKAQLQKYKGEFFLSLGAASLRVFYFIYFQRDKFTGKPKGIIRVH